MADNTKTLTEDQPIIVDQENTAILTSGIPENLANSPSKFNYVLRKEGDAANVVKKLTERYYPLRNIIWKTSDVVGKVINRIVLPDAFFKLARIPNLAYLKNYVYWNASLKLEVEVTALPQSYGCILIGWCYDFENMSIDERTLRTNYLSGLTSMDHVLLYPQGNSKEIINIPYRSFKSCGLINKQTNKLHVHDMVTVFISVLSPLRGSLESGDSCQIQVKIAFDDMIVSGITVQPQMMKALGEAYSTVRRAALNSIEQRLEQLVPDINRDFPTDISQPQEVVVRNTQAFGYGCGVGSITTSLRLDPSRTTPFSCLSGDEMKVASLAQKWGIFRTLTWKSSMASGSIITSFPVTPNCYYDVKKDTGLLNLYQIPPVGVLSNAFTFWRGSLEFLFIIPVNFVTKGKLIVTFVPHSLDDKYNPVNNSFYDAGSSYMMTYELGSEQQFIFKTPYIADTPFKRISDMRYGVAKDYIGHIVLQAFSSLVVASDPKVPDQEVDIVIMIRGGNDFELCAPSQCAIGLGNDRRISLDASYIWPYPGQNYAHLDIAIMFDDSRRYLWCYSDWYGCYTGFNNLHYGVVYERTTSDYIAFQFIHPTTNKTVTENLRFFGVPKLGYDDVWLAPLPEDRLSEYTKNPFSITMFCVADLHVQQPYYDLNTFKIMKFEVPKTLEIESNTLEVDTGAESHLLASSHFGETFTDLKDVFRRFNVYGDYYTIITKDSTIGRTVMRIPLLSRAMTLNIVDPSQLGDCRTYTREGTISVLSSCFRFFRGSIRIRLVFSRPKIGLFIGVFHDQNDIRKPDSITRPDKVDPFAFTNSMFAGVGQDLSINNVIDVQVPFYKETEFIKNGTSGNDYDFVSHILGSLKIVLNCSVKEDISLSVIVYYALGDDARYCCYNGYVPMVGISDLPPTKNIKSILPFNPQFINNERQYISLYKQKFSKELNISDTLISISDSENKSEAESQMFKAAYDNVTSVLNAPKMVTDNVEMFNKTIRDGITSTQEIITESVQSSQNVIKNQVDAILSQLNSMMSLAQDLMSEVKDKIYSLVLQVMTVVTNPTISCVILSIAQILNTLKIFTVEKISEVSQVLVSLFNYFTSLKPALNRTTQEVPQPTEQQQVVAESQSGLLEMLSESEVSAMMATLISIVANSFGVCSRFAKSPTSYFLTDLGKDLKNSANLSNSLFVFFRNSISCFIKIYNYVQVSIFSPTDRALFLINESHSDVKEWYLKALDIINPLYKQNILSSHKLILEVFVTKSIGEKIVTELLSSPITISQANICVRMLDKMREFCEEITNAHLAPKVRFEPMVLAIVGSTGIGKSYISSEIALSCLESINYKTNDPIYTRTAGVEYMNGVRNQPVIYYDDFLQVIGNGKSESTLSEFFALKTNTDFNPNIAELSGKNLRYSPLLVLLSSNRAYFNGMALGVTDQNALHRRRDILVEAKLKPEYATVNGLLDQEKISSDQLRNYDHLLFSFYNKPADEKASNDKSPDYSFADFKIKIQEKFKTYYDREQQNYKYRLEQLERVAPDYNPSISLSEYTKTVTQIYERGTTNQAEYESIQQLVTSSAPPNVNNPVSSQMYKDPVIMNMDEASTSNLVNVTISNDINFVRQFKKDLTMSKINFSFVEDKDYETLESQPVTILEDLKDHCPHYLFYINQNSCTDYQYDPSLESFICQSDECPINPTILLKECGQNCVFKYRNVKNSFLTAYLAYYSNLIDQPMSASIFPPIVKTKINDYMTKHKIPIFNHFKVINVAISSSNSSINSRTFLLNKVKDLFPTKSQRQIWLDNTKDILMTTLRKYWKYACAAFGIIGTVVGFYYLSKNSTSNVEPTPDPYIPVEQPRTDFSRLESQYISYNKSVKNQAEKAKNLRSRRTAFNNEFQSAALDVGNSIIERNAGIIEYINDKGKLCTNFYLAICSSHIVVAGHFVESLIYEKTNKNKDILFNLYIKGELRQIHFKDVKVFYDHLLSSLAVIVLPKDIPFFKDIRSHIATEKDHGSIYPFDCALYTRRNNGITCSKLNVTKEFNIPVNGTDTSNGFELYDCYSYPLGGQGMCGSVLVRNSPVFKIIGIHVAGIQTIKGYAEPITQEQFLNFKAITIRESQFNVSDSPSVQLTGTFLPVDIVPKNLVVRLANKSKYQKTEFFELFFKNTKEPAPLAKSDVRIMNIFTKSPLSYGVSKHGNPPFRFDSQLLSRCVDDLRDKIISQCPPVVIGYEVNSEMSIDQIFSGIPGFSLFKGIELDTSEGYPLQLDRPKTAHNKSWLFEYHESPNGNVLDKIHPILQEDIDKNMKMRKNNELPPTIFVDTLKDSLISKEKVIKPGSTRVFSVSPLEYTLAIKRYFGWFQAAYVNSGCKGECAIGINPDSMEWMSLYMHLTEVNSSDSGSEPEFITGDYKAFGDCLQTQCIIEVFRIMIDWYKFYFKISAEEEQIRWILCYELINGMHLAQNLLYKMFCGIPSGFPLTVETNSLVNSLYMRMAYLHNNVSNSLSYYSKDVRQVNYGDDVIISVNKSIKDKFNFCTIKSFLTAHNIEFTPSSKDTSDNRPFTPLSETTFLKRSFKPHPRRHYAMLAPLPEESVLETLNWFKFKNSIHPDTCLLENARSACNLAYCYGPEYHKKLRDSLIEWFTINKNIQFRCLSWNEIEEKAYPT